VTTEHVISHLLDAWTRTPAASEPRLDEAARGAHAELAAIRAALAAGDLRALEVYGGVNGALARMRKLAADKAGTGATKTAITSGRTWRSVRVPE